MKFKRKSLILVAVIAVGLLLAGCGAGEGEVGEDYIPIEERGYESTESLISPTELQEIKDQDDVVVVDIRRSFSHLTGHIPGAANVWRPDYEDPDHEYDGMRADAERFTDLLGEIGINNDDTVVVYTEGGGHDAARFMWLIEMYGHEDVRFLDGGIDYWSEQGFPTSFFSSSPAPTEYELDEDAIDKSRLATVEDVKEAIEEQEESPIVLDTRSEEEYIGDSDMGSRSGRIPTPYFVEWTEPINDDNTLMTAEEMEEIYDAEGVAPDKEVINYCQSGVRSSHTTFVLGELLGYEETSNYDGSWIEWSAREDLEIESDVE